MSWSIKSLSVFGSSNRDLGSCPAFELAVELAVELLWMTSRSCSSSCFSCSWTDHIWLGLRTEPMSLRPLHRVIWHRHPSWDLVHIRDPRGLQIPPLSSGHHFLKVEGIGWCPINGSYFCSLLNCITYLLNKHILWRTAQEDRFVIIVFWFRPN